ncbi:unnamed protein product [Lymnaea stagnalis]|uniref:Cyclase n=1 Tax=Lymnaea stagnalis TaxID=6523 RepID=A0AAV2HXQ0_LYMST
MFQMCITEKAVSPKSLTGIIFCHQTRAMCNTLVTLLITLALSLGDVRCCSSTEVRVVDMTHAMGNDSLLWPGDTQFTFTIINRGRQPDGYWFEFNKFDTPEHVGTHLDSPAHFSERGWRVHQIPADRLVGPGVVVDVRDKVTTNSDYRLVVSDLQTWERKHGTIPAGAIVFLWSGWDVRYPNKTLTFNTPTPNVTASFHFPGFHTDAVRWLLQNRNISMIGTDTPSTDYGQSRVFEVHQMIGEANVMGLENVNKLGEIPASGATIVVAPIKLFDGSGGPVRILALVNKDDRAACTTNSAGRLQPFWMNLW